MQYNECCLLVDCPIVSGNLPSPTDIPRHMVVYIMLLIKRREKKKRKKVGIFRCQFNRSSGSYSVEVLPVCQDRQWEAANRALLCGHVRRFIWFLYFKNKNYILWTSGTLTFLFGAETNLQPSTQSTTQLVLSLRDLCACATAIARQRDRNRKRKQDLFLENHPLLAEVHARLGGSLVGAVLEGDDILAGSQRLLREVARVGFGLARPHSLPCVARVGLHLKSPQHTHTYT